MFCKSILGIFPIEFLHEAITGYLGQNAGGGDTETDPIPSDQCSLLQRQSLDGKSIHERMSGRMTRFPQSLQSPSHGKSRGTQDIQGSNFLRTGMGNGIENLSVRGQFDKEMFTLQVSQFLGVVESRKRKSGRQDDGGSCYRTCKRTTPCLIDSGYRMDSTGEKLLLVQKGRPIWHRKKPETFFHHRAFSLEMGTL